MPRDGTKTSFKKLFAAREPIEAERWWETATPVIAEHLGLEIGGKPNELLEVAEYMVANTSSNAPNRNEICKFLVECHGFKGQWDSAWKSLNNLLPGDASRYYRQYLTVLPSLSAPPIIEIYLPRTSRHWDPEQVADLRQRFAESVLSFEREHGLSILRHYARLQDDLIESIEADLGISYDVLLGYSHFSPSTAGKQVVQKLVSDGVDAIKRAAMRHEDGFRFTFQSSTKLLDECTGWDREERNSFRSGLVWDELKFLYSFAYEYVYRTSLEGHGVDLDQLYASKHGVAVTRELSIVRIATRNHIERLWRKVENDLRAAKGMRPVGEGWIMESKLLNALREAFPNESIEAQGAPRWLGKFRFDAYFPERNIAVEYHGEQHFKPVSIFGGVVGLRLTQSRDQKKRDLCQQFGCIFIEIPAGTPMKTAIEKVRESLVNAPRTHVDLGPPRSVPPPPAMLKQFKVTLDGSNPSACARHGTGELIRELAAAGTDFASLQKGKTDSLIYVAAEAGNINTLSALIEIGLDVNARNCQRSTTALTRLCTKQRFPNLEAINILLDAGAELTHYPRGYDVSSYYAPPIMAASVSLNLPLAKLLNGRGADVNIRHKESGMTALLAVLGAYRSQPHPQAVSRVKMLDWLLQNGANPSARNLRNENIIDLLFRRSPDSEKSRDFGDILKFVLKLKPRISRYLLADVKWKHSREPRPEYEMLLNYAD